MLPELIKKTSLFSLLHRIDLNLAEECRDQSCPHCAGPLHQSNYLRKPWGAPKNIPDHQMIRQSLCCGMDGCRRRQLPPSCIFWGRRHYWSGVILVVMALRQNRPQGASTITLMRMFGISRKTLFRWISWFRDEFPASNHWQSVRGRVSATINSGDLPGSLLDHYIQHSETHEAALVGCLQLFAAGLKGF